MNNYKNSFIRNIGLITEEEQEKLHRTRVSIAGLGGVGGMHVVVLARMGIGKFHIADLDTFEAANINRQYGATINTLGRPKTEVMQEVIRAINPEAEISTYSEGVTEKNIDEFLKGTEVVIDGIDFFAIEARRLLFKKARTHGLYALTSGPIGFGSTLQIFSPLGMDFDTYFGISDNMSREEKIAAFAVGLTPRSLHLKYMDLSRVNLKLGTGPSLSSACAICSGLIATETINIILKKRKIRTVPFYFQFDPYRQIYKKGYLFLGGRNPWQRIKKNYILRKINAYTQK